MQTEDPQQDSNTNIRDQEPPWPSPLYAWFVVGILMLAYMNSFIDRQILSLLVEPLLEPSISELGPVDDASHCHEKHDKAEKGHCVVEFGGTEDNLMLLLTNAIEALILALLRAGTRLAITSVGR